eukprot:Skav220965  [mRNA]  locus=scaffold1928:297729:302167:+ [translate_table: standard]
MLYQRLPGDQQIPMKFGIFGEVKWGAKGRPWFLLYPTLSLLMGLTPLVSGASSSKVPEWVKKPEVFTEIMDLTTDATCLYTGALILLIIEEMPRMVQKQTGLPWYATMCYMSLLCGTFTSAFLTANWLSS